MTDLNLIQSSDLMAISPVIVLVIGAIAVLAADLFIGASDRRWALPWLAVSALIIALVMLNGGVGAPGAKPTEIFYGCLRIDRLTFLAQNVVLATSIFFTILSPFYLRDRRIPRGEYYTLMLLATVGMMVLPASNELLTLFLNIELLSFSLYILTGMERDNLRSTEAAFKYFLTGSYAAAFMLLGIAMVYGAVGTTFFNDMKAALTSGETTGLLNTPVFLAAGLGMMMVGFGFKLTLAPFHMYAPDVYAGGPTPVVGAIATGSKVAALVALFHVLQVFVPSGVLPPAVFVIFYVLAVASILIGNIGALVQPNIKRLLAYSGVAHNGYTMIPFVAVLYRSDLLPDAEKALAYYLVAYSLMTALAFGVAASLGARGDSDIRRYAALARRSPVLAAVLALALLSLTGVPPTVGFVGKFYLFSVAVNAGLYGLAILGVLASVASAYYYLRVIVKMYMEEAPSGQTEPIPIESPNLLALAAGAVGLFGLGLFPALVLLY